MIRQELSREEEGRRKKFVIEHGGILPQTEAFYIISVIYCASRAEDAFLRYRRLASKGGSEIDVVSSVHEALTHTASLSRFFWPARNDKLHKKRSLTLKEAFEISETSSLKNRALRNALEHFDEHLDTFLLRHDAGSFFPSEIVRNPEACDHLSTHIFKLVDPTDSVFVVLNERFDFSKVQEEVNEVLKKANQFASNGFRLPNRSTQKD